MWKNELGSPVDFTRPCRGQDYGNLIKQNHRKIENIKEGTRKMIFTKYTDHEPEGESIN